MSNTDHAPEPTARLLRFSDMLSDWDAESQSLYDAKQAGLNRGPISGLKKLDNELAGAFAPGIHILHGTPGSGKTAFGLQVACTCQCPALFVTCEMSPIELLRRVTARVTGIYLGRFKTGELAPEESGRLVREAVAAASAVALLDATQVAEGAEYLGSAAESTRRLDECSPHLLVVIDSLHSWADRVSPESTEYDRLNDGLSALGSLAHRMNVPILCIAERNRQSMSSGGLSAGAGTRRIEYSAETVIDLEASKDRTENNHGTTSITLTLAKNRHGAPGKPIHLSFHGATQTFKEA